MDHRYRKYLRHGGEPLRFRGIVLEIYKNIICVNGPKVWLVFVLILTVINLGFANVEILQVRVVCF